MHRSIPRAARARGPAAYIQPCFSPACDGWYNTRRALKLRLQFEEEVASTMNRSEEPGIVIIGLGPAGLMALEGIRDHDPDVPVTIVSGEPHYAYFRPRLSHLLGSEIAPERIAVKPPAWYGDRRAEVLLGRMARAIDVERREVVLDDDARLPARAIVLACGSRPFMPPLPGLDREGVFALRTAADAQAITRACRRAREVCVVGAGPLGLEAAWALAKLDLTVHLLEHGPRLLGKILDEQASQMLSDIVARAGIKLHLAASSESVTARGVRLASGEEIPGEVVLFSTGVRPNLDLAESAAIRVNRGVVVDSMMRTSQPWIHAAGDVAEFAGAPGGTWPVAMAQGKVAGANAAGAIADNALIEYKAVPPSYTLMVMGTRIFTIGDVQDQAGATAVVSEDAARGIRRKLVLSGGRLVGGLLFGDLAKFDKVRDGIERRIELPEAGPVPAPDYDQIMDMLIGALAPAQ